MITTLLVVQSTMEAERINRLYPDGSMLAIPPCQLTTARFDVVLIPTYPESRAMWGEDAYEAWLQESVVCRANKPEGVIWL